MHHGSGDLGPGEKARELLHRRLPVERQREALEVVDALPSTQGVDRGREVGRRHATPELLGVDAMAALDLAVLFRAARPDVAVFDARLLHRQREGQRELGAVVAVEPTNGEREGPPQLRQGA